MERPSRAWFSDWKFAGPCAIVVGLAISWWAVSGLLREPFEMINLVAGGWGALLWVLPTIYFSGKGTPPAGVLLALGGLAVVAFGTRFGCDSAPHAVCVGPEPTPEWLKWMVAGYIVVPMAAFAYLGVRLIRSRGGPVDDQPAG